MNLSSSFADVIHVDVEANFTTTKCFAPGRGYMPCFSNDFEVYIYRGESQPALDKTNIVSLFESQVYKIRDNSLPGTSQSFNFNRNGTKGVSFAVRSRGACGKIFNMAVYYYFCEETFVNSIRLMKTLSPLSGSKLVPANCSENSSPLNASRGLQGNCYSNGSWDVNEDFKCLCTAGYEANKTRGCSGIAYINKIRNANNYLT